MHQGPVQVNVSKSIRVHVNKHLGLGRKLKSARLVYYCSPVLALEVGDLVAIIISVREICRKFVADVRTGTGLRCKSKRSGAATRFRRQLLTTARAICRHNEGPRL